MLVGSVNLAEEILKEADTKELIMMKRMMKKTMEAVNSSLKY